MSKKNILCLAAAALLLPLQSFAQTTVAGFTPGSFRVNESGAAEYSISIRIPPGIAGMQPKVSLVYNSQAGNSLLGTGWNLTGLSSIHRCGRTIVQDGLGKGVTYEADDRYCLDGQRLVAVNGAYGANGTEYRTERETFTRVISYGTAGTGPAYFKAWTKSGQILEYGNTADSRIEAQGKSSVAVWAMNKRSDTKGNYLKVTYGEDNANGDFWPLRIDYTGNDAAGVSPFASVRYSYQARSDVGSSYVGGSVVKVQNRLTNVKTYVGESMVTDYRVSYAASASGASRLSSVTECAADNSCFAPHVMGWQDGAGGPIWGAPSPWMSSGGPSYAVGDVNGDGLADIVWASGGSLYVSYSNGAGVGYAVPLGINIGTVTVSVWCDDAGNCWPSTVPISFAIGDINGDGLADLVYAGAIHLSNGGGFGAPIAWSGAASSIAVADVNGDGLADVVWADSGGNLYLNMSTGSALGGAASLGINVGVAPCNACGNGITATSPNAFALGDVNGDGRADLVYANQLQLSTGSWFGSPVTWSGPGLSQGMGGLAVADVNGDGLADVVWADTGGIPTVYINFANGNGLGSATSLGLNLVSLPNLSWINFVALGDLNGDGRADLTYYAYVVGSSMALSQPQTPDLATSITNSLGSSISVTYKPITDSAVYAKDSDAVWPVRDLQRGPQYLAASTSVPNLVGGNIATNYFYRGGKVHARVGPLGFRQVQSTDAQTLIKTTTTFRQDYPFQGLPLSSVTAQGSGATLAQSTHSWADTTSANSSGKYHRSDLTQTVETGNDLNGAALPSITTGTTYDALGNALTVNVGTGDGYSKLTSNIYADDQVNWQLGRLTRSQVTASSPSSPQLVRLAGFAYDGSSGLVTKEIVEPDDSNLCLVTEYQYDVFGNKTSATSRNCNGSTGEAVAPTGSAVVAPSSTSSSYAATTANPVAGQFPTSSTNALGHIENKEFDARFGVINKLTGPNGLVTTWTFDAFGRTLQENRADNTNSTSSFVLCGTCPTGGKYAVSTTSTGAPTSTAYYDALNRAFRTETQGFDGTLIRKDTEYDSLGRVLRTSRPYLSTASPVWTTLTYDLLGRVLTQTEPNGAVVTSTYNGLTTTLTNALNQTETRLKNSQGQLIRVTRQ